MQPVSIFDLLFIAHLNSFSHLLRLSSNSSGVGKEIRGQPYSRFSSKRLPYTLWSFWIWCFQEEMAIPFHICKCWIFEGVYHMPHAHFRSRGQYSEREPIINEILIIFSEWPTDTKMRLDRHSDHYSRTPLTSKGNDIFPTSFQLLYRRNYCRLNVQYFHLNDFLLFDWRLLHIYFSRISRMPLTFKRICILRIFAFNTISIPSQLSFLLKSAGLVWLDFCEVAHLCVHVGLDK